MDPRIIKLGKRKFVLGMEWRDHSDTSIGELIDPDVLKLRPYCIKMKSGTESVLGWVVVPAGQAKGALISYAAAVATTAPSEPAIYVADLGDGCAWYCVVVDGLVVERTDIVDSIEVVARAAETLRNQLGYSLYVAAAGELKGRFQGAKEFDSEAIVARAKQGQLTRYSASTGVIKGLVAVALVAAAGAVFWKLTHENQGQVLQEQAVADREAYIAAARSQIDWPWLDSTWVDIAWESIVRPVPTEFAGWVRTEVACSPVRCVVTYQGSGPRSLRALQSRFGEAGRVQAISPSQVSVMFLLPQSQPVGEVDDADLLHPQAAKAVPAIETATGLIGRYADFVTDGAPAVTPLGGGAVVPSDGEAMSVAKVSIRGAWPDRARIVGAVEHFGLAGWVASGLTVKSADFTLEFSRLEATP